MTILVDFQLDQRPTYCGIKYTDIARSHVKLGSLPVEREINGTLLLGKYAQFCRIDFVHDMKQQPQLPVCNSKTALPGYHCFLSTGADEVRHRVKESHDRHDWHMFSRNITSYAVIPPLYSTAVY